MTVDPADPEGTPSGQPADELSALPFGRLAASCGGLTHFIVTLTSLARPLLAATAGLLWAGSFPSLGIAGLAWVAPGLLLFAAVGREGVETFRLGYIAGLTHYLVSLYWLLLIPFPAGAVAGWLALSAYLALYPAAWVWFCWGCFPVKPASASQPLLPACDHFLSATWLQRTTWILLCATAWVALEIVLSRFLTGFPWNLLGASQYQIVPVIQIAAITGVYGVSFLVVWFAVALASALLLTLRRPSHRWGWRNELALPLLTLVGVSLYGFQRVLQMPSPKRELPVALVQPSIPQRLIWDPRETTNRFDKLIQLSEAALAARPDLLVWPEASLPDFSESSFVTLTNLIAKHRVWMIFGADDAEQRRPESTPSMFNASFLFDPQGHYVASYRKRRLVIFGEYVPLVRWLPFLKFLTPIGSGFTPGERPVPFKLDTLEAKTSSLICFEDVFPHLARGYVEADTDFLVNLTNNGWFGESAAQWQHAASAAFRAVENGLPLVRCANNGLTCWVDSVGRMRDIYRSDAQDIYGPGFHIVRVPLLEAGTHRPLTFYTRHGDVFGWGCVVIAGSRLLALWARARVRRPCPAGEPGATR